MMTDDEKEVARLAEFVGSYEELAVQLYRFLPKTRREKLARFEEIAQGFNSEKRGRPTVHPLATIWEWAHLIETEQQAHPGRSIPEIIDSLLEKKKITHSEPGRQSRPRIVELITRKVHKDKTHRNQFRGNEENIRSMNDEAANGTEEPPPEDNPPPK